MIIAGGLIVSRFVHYLAVSVLFGGALFPLYGLAQPKPDLDGPLTWLRPFLFGAALLGLVSGIAWFGFAMAEVNASASAVGKFMTIRNPEFAVWLFRLLLAVGLVLLLLGSRVAGRRFHAVLFGSLILLASIAWTGHAGSDQSSAAPVHRILDAFHLVGAGVWIGALAVLVRLAMIALNGPSDSGLRILHDALSRFSSVGSIVVATLALSGILNPSFLSSFRTAYGQVLLAKLAIFGAMLLLAAGNRYWLTPSLSRTLKTASGSQAITHALALSLLAETTLAVLALVLVAWLGILSPALR
jgi:copper resistance protein D